MSCRGTACVAAMGPPLPQPIPTWEKFIDTWMPLATCLEVRPTVSIPDPRRSGRSWPLQFLAKYVQSRPSFVDHSDLTRP